MQLSNFVFVVAVDGFVYKSVLCMPERIVIANGFGL